MRLPVTNTRWVLTCGTFSATSEGIGYSATDAGTDSPTHIGKFRTGGRCVLDHFLDGMLLLQAQIDRGGRRDRRLGWSLTGWSLTVRHRRTDEDASPRHDNEPVHATAPFYVV